ncbi:hypothetical protein OXPF_22730 [Oxobacter pfennigii]|uniref:YqzL-like protein n=1 Tax=Oxobacter pfennigii TaxID=36849 RepID=A0A0P8YWK5_9CLOT|nr:YqzL family protein [Oxobacter pfennigii]KPU44106.1 hypothetical protein OXPF_22730 [Oxobacter pfennigii]
MLDIISWKLFEKTGCIDAYLLYIDMKKINDIKGYDEDKDSLLDIISAN